MKNFLYNCWQSFCNGWKDISWIGHKPNWLDWTEKIAMTIFYLFFGLLGVVASPIIICWVVIYCFSFLWEGCLVACRYLMDRVSIVLIFTLFGLIFGSFYSNNVAATGAIVGFLIGCVYGVIRVIGKDLNIDYSPLSGTVYEKPKTNYYSSTNYHNQNYKPTPTPKPKRPWAWEGFMVSDGPKEDDILRT